jgi:hypothetical protein
MIADARRMSDYYRQIFAFERVSASIAIRYVCYEDLRSGKFCVSGGDILRAPEHAETLSFRAIKEVDIFIERLPDVWFDTPIEAIEDIAPIFEKERQA